MAQSCVANFLISSTQSKSANFIIEMKHNLTTHPSLAVELYTGRAAARQPVRPDSEDSFFLEQVTLTPTWMRSMVSDPSA